MSYFGALRWCKTLSPMSAIFGHQKPNRAKLLNQKESRYVFLLNRFDVIRDRDKWTHDAG